MSNIFLKINGVERGSKDAIHKGEIEAFLCTWGNPDEPKFSGQGSGGGTDMVHDVTLEMLWTTNHTPAYNAPARWAMSSTVRY
jgi:hypothetical protein